MIDPRTLGISNMGKANEMAKVLEQHLKCSLLGKISVSLAQEKEPFDCAQEVSDAYYKELASTKRIVLYTIRDLNLTEEERRSVTIQLGKLAAEYDKKAARILRIIQEE